MEDWNRLFARESVSTPHGAIPFDKIAVADIRGALRYGMEQENREIAQITENPTEPTFENTVAAFEAAGNLLDQASTVMYNLLSANTSDELDELAQDMAQTLSDHGSAIMLNSALFARIKSVYNNREQLKLTDEDRMLLAETYDSFIRSGANLDGRARDRYREIRAELSNLSVQFSQNLLKETNAKYLHLTERGELAGLPDMQVQQAEAAARERNLPGWVVTLHAPSYQPFMTYADRRDLRERLYRLYNTRCASDGEYGNMEVVRRIVNLRVELAQLLGYTTYAEYVLKHRMAQDTGHVYGLLNELITNYKGIAKTEVEAVRQLACETEGAGFELMPWDFSYYAHKLQVRDYNLDAEMLRPYFELSRVKSGVFGLATRLYGITFRENSDIPVYHPDVKAYDVYDVDGTFLAALYLDFHPRVTKQGGAWMTNYREESNYTERPHVSLTMNLTQPTADKPALLTLSEVETFLHEFGHALHSIFANTKYASLSGTNVYWDFVELPSQFMENFAAEKEFLQTFAFHYQTGEVIPDELIARIERSRNFNVAYACMRQVSYGLLDMAFHTLDKPLTGDVAAFEREARKEADLLPVLDDCCMAVQFSHIMSGGYAAGYYSYKWAEVLDADAFAEFKRTGIFSIDTARRFRDCVLSRGATRPPMSLYKDFRGHEPTIEALLERNGLRSSGKKEQPAGEK